MSVAVKELARFTVRVRSPGAGLAFPRTLPLGMVRKTGRVAGTMPSARALDSSTGGAATAAIAWVNEASVRASSRCCDCNSLTTKAVWAMDVLISNMTMSPNANTMVTTTANNPRLARSGRSGATSRRWGRSFRSLRPAV